MRILRCIEATRAKHQMGEGKVLPTVLSMDAKLQVIYVGDPRFIFIQTHMNGPRM